MAPNVGLEIIQKLASLQYSQLLMKLRREEQIREDKKERRKSVTKTSVKSNVVSESSSSSTEFQELKKQIEGLALQVTAIQGNMQPSEKKQQ